MKIKPLFISAPSRSGSSLLIKILNCANNIVIVNEPINSVNIVDRCNIRTIFKTIEENLKYNIVIQRVDPDGFEVTDTYPPSKIKWGIINHYSEGVEIIGIKKSFPAFSNKDFFKPFIKEWPSFASWMKDEMDGSVIVIIRDPRYAIISWKTTFEALRAETEKQCAAWNLIASTILASRDKGVKIFRYEDLVLNKKNTIANIENYLGIRLKPNELLPEIKQFSMEDYSVRKNIRLSILESEFKNIEKLCGEVAKNFGYKEMLL